MCISYEEVCDFKIDCLDRADEREASCQKKLNISLTSK